jgi:hypothetical protein
MKILVSLGSIEVAGVIVRRHTGGIFTIQISTPHEKHPGIVFGGGAHPGQGLLLYPFSPGSYQEPTGLSFEPDTNEEEEALSMGLFDVLDDWSRYSVTLIAVPAAVLEESEEIASWEPQGAIDYLEA